MVFIGEALLRSAAEDPAGVGGRDREEGQQPLHRRGQVRQPQEEHLCQHVLANMSCHFCEHAFATKVLFYVKMF